MRPTRCISLLICTVLLCRSTGGQTAPTAVDPGTGIGFPQHPALSPDGATLVFSWAGDLWASGSGGGPSTRLTAHPATERRSVFSPDGTMLAFESDRDGARNIYVMHVDGAGASMVGGTVRRLTVSDQGQNLAGFDVAGNAVCFSSRQHPTIYRHQMMFRTPLDGGPVERITDAFGSDPHPDVNGDILFTRGGNTLTRPLYRGPGAPDVYRFTPRSGAFTRLTTSPSTEAQAFGRPDGSVIFLSSRDGQNNLWMLEPDLPGDRHARQLTRFKPTIDESSIGHGVRDLRLSWDGRHAVFCVWDTIYSLDLDDAESWPEPIIVTGAADSDRHETRRMNLADKVEDVALSPDGRTVAVVARGEIFVRNVDEDHPTRRVTRTSSREQQVSWSPDGTSLYFAADDGTGHDIMRAIVALSRADLDSGAAGENDEPDKADGANGPDDGVDGAETDDEATDDDSPKAGDRWADAIGFTLETVVGGDADDRTPLPSPDGRRLLFVRGRGDLVIRDLTTGDERIVHEGWDEPEALWAPDSRHIVYAVADLDFNTDVWLLDTSGVELSPINLTRHPDTDMSPRLSADGKVLVFLSERAGNNDELDVWRVHLDRTLDGLSDYQLAAHFEEASEQMAKRKPIPTPVVIGADDTGSKDATEPVRLRLDADDAYLRATRLTTIAGDVESLAMKPAGDRILFSARIDGDTSLYSIGHDGKDRELLTAGDVRSLSVSLTGETCVYVRSGGARSLPTKGGKEESLPIEATIAVDLGEQQSQKFLEGARLVGTMFYHPTLKGIDWVGLTARYAPLAGATRTNGGFNRVLSTLFGELNGSHLGVSGGDDYTANAPAVGHLGAVLEPVDRGLRVVRTIKGGPAANETSRLEPGDVITMVDGEAIGAHDVNHVMLGKADHEVLLEVSNGDREDRYVLIVPVGDRAWRNLMYEDEVERRRALVHELSGGRIGYLHIRSMGAESVRTFERDLYAAADAREGLVIDVRDNGGGWTTDILLASLTAPAHAYTVPRGAERATAAQRGSYPRGRRLIYAYQRPISVLINENSFSNAEIFAHAIRTIGRGRLVGTQTFGGVISTGSHTLIDGTRVRVPFRGWYLPDGTDMELHGAKPHVPVPQTPEDEAAGRDPQLEAAVHDLLARLDA